MAEGPALSRALELTDPAVPRCSLNVHVPYPVDERLRRLAALVNAEKLGPTSKKELAAALIQTAEEDALPLWDRVLRFRNATVGNAAFWVPDTDDPVEFEGRERGRPGSG
jgi:hypothetical protein